jgi:hypothetical protein
MGNNLRNGNGVFTFSNGNIYKGGFKDDTFHGKGALSFTDGNPTMDGNWNHGRFEKN